jgi:hypothetical protein
MKSKWSMEVVLETVKLRTANSIYDHDEVLLSNHVLFLSVNGVLFRNGANQLILVRGFSKRGADRDVCNWLGLESCALVLVLKVVDLKLFE